MDRILIGLVVSLVPAVALAHPDHGEGSVPLHHWLSDPFHLALVGAAVVVAVGLGHLRPGRARR